MLAGLQEECRNHDTSMVILKLTMSRCWVYYLLVRGFALCMQPDVFVEIAGVSEGTETELTFQWFVSSVGPAKGDIILYLNNGMEHIP